MPTTDLPPIYLALIALAAFGLGFLIHYLIARATQVRLESMIAQRDALLRNDEARIAEQAASLERAQSSLKAAFQEMAQDSLARNNKLFLELAEQKFNTHEARANADLSAKEKAVEGLIKPIHEALNKTREQIDALEKTRAQAYGSIKTEIEKMSSSQQLLRDETSKLVTALRRPEVRGQYGELTLRRLVELAGMVNHCDFEEQVNVTDIEGKQYRPDMIVRLPDDGILVVDAKTPMDAYLSAVEANDDVARKAALLRHSKNVSERIKELASKAYWSQFERSPDFALLFIPGDQFLTAALDQNPNLLEEALRQKVMLVTPTSLMALLKVVAYGWLQLSLAENAEEIKKLAEDLYDRMGTFTNHLGQVGKQLESSVKSYNRAIGSLESRVLPAARRFTELGVQPGKNTPIEPPMIEIIPRPLSLPDSAGHASDSNSEKSDPEAS
jgi:DNA recombination protein RmuC